MSAEAALAVIYGLLLALGALYAAGLEWAERRYHFRSDYTWATVVIGTGLVLLVMLAVVPWQAVVKIFFGFAAAGLPQIASWIASDHRRKRQTEAAGRE